MMFQNLKVEYLQGLGPWFWYRESWGLVMRNAQREYRMPLSSYKTEFEKIMGITFFIVGFTIASLFAITIGAYVRRQNAMNELKKHGFVFIFNKKNIKYLKVLDTLNWKAND